MNNKDLPAGWGDNENDQDCGNPFGNNVDNDSEPLWGESAENSTKSTILNKIDQVNKSVEAKKTIKTDTNLPSESGDENHILAKKDIVSNDLNFNKNVIQDENCGPIIDEKNVQKDINEASKIKAVPKSVNVENMSYNRCADRKKPLENAQVNNSKKSLKIIASVVGVLAIGSACFFGGVKLMEKSNDEKISTNNAILDSSNTQNSSEEKTESETASITTTTESTKTPKTNVDKKTTTRFTKDSLYSPVKDENYSGTIKYKIVSDTSFLNLRFGPSKDYDIQLQIPNGEFVEGSASTMSKQGDEWVYVNYNGTSGWVMRELLSTDTTPNTNPNAKNSKDQMYSAYYSLVENSDADC